MALQVTTLGGGGRHTATAAPGRSEKEEEDEYEPCTGCGFEATTEVIGRDGLTYGVCSYCEDRIREQEAEDDDYLECADCGASLGPGRTPTQFIHLTKGDFWLCPDCWTAADHEEDYLEYCSCSETVYWKAHDGSISCYWCFREVRNVEHCDCPVPSIDKETPNHCLFCKGAVMNKKDE
jgi:hypothetical protein